MLVLPQSPVVDRMSLSMRCLFLLLCSVGLMGCFDNFYVPPVSKTNLGNKTSSNWEKEYDDLLQKYVNPANGLVDYKGLYKDKSKLDGILLALKGVNPKGWDDNQRLAFWINAYNIGMLWNIIEKMQTDGADVFATKKVSDFGDLFFRNRKFDIAGLNLSLDMIENGIIRHADAWKDKFPKDYYVERLRPEIHAAVSCAAMSCPPIKNTIWRSSTVDQELKDALTKVLNDTRFAILDASSGKPKMGQVFEWYYDDFKYNGKTAGAYLGSFVKDPKLKEALKKSGNDKAKLSFIPYDWTLNLWRK